MSAAEPPPPVSWLGRIAGHGADARRRRSCRHGRCPHLPSRHARCAGRIDDRSAVALLAVEQAVRLSRGGVVRPGDRSTKLATDSRRGGGRGRRMDRRTGARSRARASRGAPGRARETIRSVQPRGRAARSKSCSGTVSRTIRSSAASDVPLCATSSESREWARRRHRRVEKGIAGPGVSVLGTLSARPAVVPALRGRQRTAGAARGAPRRRNAPAAADSGGRGRRRRCRFRDVGDSSRRAAGERRRPVRPAASDRSRRPRGSGRARRLALGTAGGACRENAGTGEGGPACW